jgi:hypothetical protein
MEVTCRTAGEASQAKTVAASNTIIRLFKEVLCMEE